PETAIFIKYEFWYNYLNQLNKRNIPTYLISGIFRENHIFFKCYGKWFRKALCAYKHFFVQNESSSLLLQSIGLKNITVCGDTRFDRVLAISEKSGDNEILENFKAGKQILIGGSTWDRDENIIIEFINNSENELKFIIVPHEINDSQIDEIIEKLKVKTVKYSRASENNLIGAVVMIIDNVGMLSSIYKYANIAYIGGGFGAGIHNVLEPASFGMPVLFGPNYQNFEEAKELITRGGAFSVNNYQQFSDVVNSLLTDKKKLKNSSEISFGFIKESIGATSIIVNELISD
ncbi:3-deoxy-D-manno-octulosonic acid transferase, partial [Bacteroidota bacterium]